MISLNIFAISRGKNNVLNILDYYHIYYAFPFISPLLYSFFSLFNVFEIENINIISTDNNHRLIKIQSTRTNQHTY